jgi:hypothetical protein
MQILVEVSYVSSQMLILLPYCYFKFEIDLNKGCEKCEGLQVITTTPG